MKNFIDPGELYKNINDENTVIVDCRGDLLDGNYGRSAYEKSHIPGAVFIDVKKDLSSEETAHGGRNPLPDLKIFKEKLELLGIGSETRVIAYDEQRIACAARLCWMLRLIGHTSNFVLNGGIGKWEALGYPLIKEVPDSNRNRLELTVKEDILATMEYVRNNLNKGCLIDSRTEARYLGKQELIDKKAGRIPGAINIYWKNLLNADGTAPAKERLEEVFKAVKGCENVTVYCGSGIDAAFNYMLLDEIGVKARLYLGSFSDWITYPENKIIGG